MRLTTLAQQAELSEKDILEIFTLIGERGDIIMLKHDGLRTTVRYTVLASIAGRPEQQFRHDSDDLHTAVKNVLAQYVQALSL